MKDICNLATLAVLLGALPAMAENLTAGDPQSIVEVMQSEGYVAKLTTDDLGDPKIESRISDTTYSVYFYGCERGKDCASIQFSAGYDIDGNLDFEKANGWLRDNRYARVIVDDEGDPFLRMDVLMYPDGIGVATFIEYLDLWRILVEDFEPVIDW
ncbi:MAG: YbjN domain-containing protein [Paracoccaceae bacterium]